MLFSSADLLSKGRVAEIRKDRKLLELESNLVFFSFIIELFALLLVLFMTLLELKAFH